MKKKEILLLLQQVNSLEICIDSFSASPGEGWCWVGANTSGVDKLGEILSDEAEELSYEKLVVPDKIGIVTFSGQQALFEEELRKDDSDYMNKLDPGTPAAQFITAPELHGDLIDACNMRSSLQKGYRQLSSGQSRKISLLAEVSRGVNALMVQSPFEGIDQKSCQDINQMFSALLQKGIMVIITVNNIRDIPSWCTHIAVVEKGRIAKQGPAAEILDHLDDTLLASDCFEVSSAELRTEKQVDRHIEAPLVLLKNGFGGYGEEVIFSGLDISIAEGEHTLISGPNGCGKSTLLHLITGDHPWCYKNDLHIFGIRRGSGESIWDLKRQMGIVSSELHRNHLISGSCLQVVISGLFDSIGLYTKPTKQQVQLAEKWIARLRMSDVARQAFKQQSFARQRLLLIGRALIKVPRLLILDEPTLGLDQGSRKALLDLLGEIAEEKLCTLVYVSHRQDEYRPFFVQHVQL